MRTETTETPGNSKSLDGPRPSSILYAQHTHSFVRILFFLPKAKGLPRPRV